MNGDNDWRERTPYDIAVAQENAGIASAAYTSRIAELERDLAAAQARIQALERDAARYQWLRNDCAETCIGVYEWIEQGTASRRVWLAMAELDEAIDHARGGA